jgi:hypothetical protein
MRDLIILPQVHRAVIPWIKASWMMRQELHWSSFVRTRMNTIENSFDYQMRVNVCSTLTFIHVPSSFQEDPPLLRHKGI